MLPKEAIQEFKRIYAKIYGIKLNDQEAARRANNLVALYRAVYGKPRSGRIEEYKLGSDTNTLSHPDHDH